MKGLLNADAPHFESREETREPSLQCDNRFLIKLLNINDIEDVAKRIDGSGGIDVMVDMGNHLKPFAMESMLLDKQVRNWGLTVEHNDLLPPNSCCGIGVRGDQLL